MRAVVIGGGLAGLSVAHRLLELAPEMSLTVLEATERPGGLLGTVERDGFVIETGPDSILSAKRAAVDLAERLGIADRLIETRGEHRGAYVVCKGRLEKVPEGFSLVAPTRVLPFLQTPIVSRRGKLRALLEPIVPVRRDADDESMAGFVTRRLGREVLERLAQPLVGGIYGGDPELLSLRATMPRFLEMEERDGSVIRGLRRAGDANASGARYGLFVAFDRGMQVLIDALAARVGARLACTTRVTSLAREGTWIVETDRGERIEAEHVVLASGAWNAARLLEPHDRFLSDALFSIDHGSAATVTFAYAREDISHPLDAFGLVVPTVERRSILAATFSSVKWPGRAPDSKVLLRVFIGGENAPDVLAHDDATLIAMARRELRSLMQVQAEPLFSITRRYPHAMPQYQVGHAARVQAIEEATAKLAGIHLAGNALHGVGIPDTVRHAEGVAERILMPPTPGHLKVHDCRH